MTTRDQAIFELVRDQITNTGQHEPITKLAKSLGVTLKHLRLKLNSLVDYGLLMKIDVRTYRLARVQCHCTTVAKVISPHKVDILDPANIASWLTVPLDFLPPNENGLYSGLFAIQWKNSGRFRIFQHGTLLALNDQYWAVYPKGEHDTFAMLVQYDGQKELWESNFGYHTQDEIKILGKLLTTIDIH